MNEKKKNQASEKEKRLLRTVAEGSAVEELVGKRPRDVRGEHTFGRRNPRIVGHACVGNIFSQLHH